MTPPSSVAELERRLRAVLATARLEPHRLPLVPELELWLINADFSNAALTAEETARVLDYPAYWAFCWASGQVLARWLLDHPEVVAGKRVLDFGSGSGVAGIAAARAGAAEVIACDIDADALLACSINAERNGVELTLAPDFDAVAEPVDLILAADVLYDRVNLGWLDRFLQRAPAVLVGDSRVRNFDFPGYSSLGMHDAATVPDLDESAEFRRVTLYRGASHRGANPA